MNRTPGCLSMALLLVILAALPGCLGKSGPPMRYYTLSSVSDPGQTEPAGSAPGPRITIMPVKVPAYLDRRSIVTVAGPNEFALADNDSWAEPVRENIAGALARDLSVIVPTERIAIHPDRGLAPDAYAVAVTVRHFEGTLGGSAVFDAIWSVRPPAGGGGEIEGRTVYTEPLHGNGYDSLVAALSRGVERMSRDIGDVLRSRP